MFVNEIECFFVEFRVFFKVIFLFTNEKNFFKRLKVGNIKYFFLRVRQGVKIVFTLLIFFFMYKTIIF
jgi:hypothetical protein